MRRRSALPGFTLIELLACLAIVAMSAIVVLAQFRARRDERLALAARQIMAELMSAQSRAIEQRKPQIAMIDPRAESHRLATSAPAQPGQPMGPAVAAVNFDGQSEVAFDDLGMPYTYRPHTGRWMPLADGSVVVKDGPEKMTVRILPVTGQIQVQ